MSLLLNILSRFIIAFLSRSRHLLILWLQSLSAVKLEPKEIKFATASTFSPSFYHEVMRLHAMLMLSFKPDFSLSSFTFIKKHFLPLEWLFVIQRIVAHKAPLSMEFSRQRYWSGLPFHTPRDLHNSDM